MDLLHLGRGCGLGEALRHRPWGRPTQCLGQSRDPRSHTRLVLGPKEMLPLVRTMLGRRTEKDLRNIKKSEVIGPSLSEGGRGWVLTTAGGGGVTALVPDAESLERALQRGHSRSGVAHRSASFPHGKGPSTLTLSPGKARLQPHPHPHPHPTPTPRHWTRIGAPGSLLRVPCYRPCQVTACSTRAAGGPQPYAEDTGVWSTQNSQVRKHLWGFRKEGGSND